MNFSGWQAISPFGVTFFQFIKYDGATAVINNGKAASVFFKFSGVTGTGRMHNNNCAKPRHDTYTNR